MASLCGVVVVRRLRETEDIRLLGLEALTMMRVVRWCQQTAMERHLCQTTSAGWSLVMNLINLLLFLPNLRKYVEPMYEVSPDMRWLSAEVTGSLSIGTILTPDRSCDLMVGPTTAIVLTGMARDQGQSL